MANPPVDQIFLALEHSYFDKNLPVIKKLHSSVASPFRIFQLDSSVSNSTTNKSTLITRRDLFLENDHSYLNFFPVPILGVVPKSLIRTLPRSLSPETFMSREERIRGRL